MQKKFSIIFLILISFLISGTAAAENTQKPTPPIKRTAEQQTCIKSAQDKRLRAVKSVEDTFNNATKDDTKIMQAALDVARKAKDSKKRMAAIQAAEETFNNGNTVKQAKIPWLAGVKSANSQYQSDLKACLNRSSNPAASFVKSIGAGISDSFSNVINFFTGKK